MDVGRGSHSVGRIYGDLGNSVCEDITGSIPCALCVLCTWTLLQCVPVVYAGLLFYIWNIDWKSLNIWRLSLAQTSGQNRFSRHPAPLLSTQHPPHHAPDSSLLLLWRARLRTPVPMSGLPPLPPAGPTSDTAASALPGSLPTAPPAPPAPPAAAPTAARTVPPTAVQRPPRSQLQIPPRPSCHSGHSGGHSGGLSLSLPTARRGGSDERARCPIASQGRQQNTPDREDRVDRRDEGQGRAPAPGQPEQPGRVETQKGQKRGRYNKFNGRCSMCNQGEERSEKRSRLCPDNRSCGRWVHKSRERKCFDVFNTSAPVGRRCCVHDQNLKDACCCTR